MRSMVFLIAVAMVSSLGCSKFQEANWWADRMTPASEVSTTSADGIYAQNRSALIRQRDWDSVPVQRASETVTHWPLWWEDPFTDKGSEDGRFAWTYEDYVAVPSALGRFILNTMGFPASATVTPPFTVMASDGQLSRQALGYDHDTERYRPGQSDAGQSDTSANEDEQVTEIEVQTESAPEPSSEKN